MTRVQPWGGVAGKRVVITGATNGIGLAAAVELARRGAQLTLVARSESRAADVVRRIQAERADAQVDVLLADLASQASIRPPAGVGGPYEVPEHPGPDQQCRRDLRAATAEPRRDRAHLGGESPRPLSADQPAARPAQGQRPGADRDDLIGRA